MRTLIARALLLACVAYLVTGCTTIRTATFEDKGYDSVFKSSIKGLCTDRELIVYEADKAQGNINVMVGGLFGGQIISVKVANQGANATAVTATAQGISPYPDRMIAAITQQVYGGGKTGAKTNKKKRVVVIEEGEEGDSGTSSGMKEAAPVETKPVENAPAPATTPEPEKKRGSLF